NGDTKFTGTADAKQENQLIGTITVVVTNVYSNGNLHERGEKWITINDGDEYVRVSGIVRNQDISPDNQIDSNRIADARITYSGRGAFANSSKPGWLMKILTSPWWPI
ncbi:MAG: flagellar basal body L-ring protein FlgH, partial [Candidatus Berkiella sp.]